MGLEEIVDGSAAQFEDVTVGELIQQYGEEPVRRGLSYMASLSDADQNYREASRKADEYGEGYSKGVADDPDADTEEIENRWADAIEDSGIGIND